MRAAYRKLMIIQILMNSNYLFINKIYNFLLSIKNQRNKTIEILFKKRRNIYVEFLKEFSKCKIFEGPHEKVWRAAGCSSLVQKILQQYRNDDNARVFQSLAKRDDADYPKVNTAVCISRAGTRTTDVPRHSQRALHRFRCSRKSSRMPFLDTRTR